MLPAELPDVRLVAGGGALGWAWTRRWRKRLHPYRGDDPNLAFAPVAVARLPDVVGSAPGVAWWLDGDQLVDALSRRSKGKWPERIRRLVVSKEENRRALMGRFAELANQIVSTADVDLGTMLRAEAIPLAAEPRSILIAGHDFRFIEPVAADLEAAGHTILWDPWVDGFNHDEDRSRSLLQQADTIICEWALGNAVWYSRQIVDGQRLVVRLHRYELDRPFGPQVDTRKVSRFVTVSQFVAAAAEDRFGWPGDKIEVIQNGVDVVGMSRPKRPGWEHRLGLVGYGTPLKRFDLALDLLRRLRQTDPTFSLMVRGHRPEQLPWVWHHEEPKAFSLQQRRRIEADPLLRDAVEISDYSPGLAEWLRSVGFILSVSDVESFHLALAEGMASGATPVILPREGAAELWGTRWLHDTVDSAADTIHATAAEGRNLEEGRLARKWVADRYTRPQQSDRWRKLI